MLGINERARAPVGRWLTLMRKQEFDSLGGGNVAGISEEV